PRIDLRVLLLRARDDRAGRVEHDEPAARRALIDRPDESAHRPTPPPRLVATRGRATLTRGSSPRAPATPPSRRARRGPTAPRRSRARPRHTPARRTGATRSRRASRPR